jgi:hypothetical protein
MASCRAEGFRAKCSETFHSRPAARIAPLACCCPLGDELPRRVPARRARQAQKRLICRASAGLTGQPWELSTSLEVIAFMIASSSSV